MRRILSEAFATLRRCSIIRRIPPRIAFTITASPFLLLTSGVWAIQPGGDLPVYDARKEVTLPSVQISSDLLPEQISARMSAENRLRESDPDFRVTYDTLFGTPTHIRSTTRFLTKRAPGVDAMDILNAYVVSNKDVLQLNSVTLPTTRILSDYRTRHNGVRHIQLQQTVNGLDLIGATLGANFTRDGELINLSSYLLPGVGLPPLTPALDAEHALEAAAKNVGINMTQRPGRLNGVPSAKIRFARTAEFADSPTAELAYFPMSRADFHLVWKVSVPENGLGNIYEIYVDTSSARILYRSNLTKYFDSEGGFPNTTTISPGTPSSVSLSTEAVSYTHLRAHET